MHINRWNEVKKDKGVRERSLYRPWYQFALSLIIDHVGPAGKVIDIGCGVGEFCESLRSFNFDVVAADGNLGQAKTVHELGFPIIVSNFEYNLPYKSDTFHLVTTLEVIEHLIRPEHFLNEIYRVLKPGGFMVLSTPNFLFYQRRLWYLFGHDLDGEGIHLRFFTPRKLRNLIDKIGFSFLKSSALSPVSGLNKIRRLFDKSPIYFRVPNIAESFLAYDLVYLLMKPGR